MSDHCNTCSNKCLGFDDYHGGCCCIENRDYIIGPIKDFETFLKNLSLKLGREVFKKDVFIEYEEGKNLFPKRPMWQIKENYPALRVDLDSTRKFCIFYNQSLRYCTVYDIRPETCINFMCDYLKTKK